MFNMLSMWQRVCQALRCCITVSVSHQSLRWIDGTCYRRQEVNKPTQAPASPTQLLWVAANCRSGPGHCCPQTVAHTTAAWELKQRQPGRIQATHAYIASKLFANFQLIVYVQRVGSEMDGFLIFLYWGVNDCQVLHVGILFLTVTRIALRHAKNLLEKENL